MALVAACDRELAAERAARAEEDDDDDEDDEADFEDMAALRRLDAGLFTLQLVDFVIGEVCRYHGESVCFLT